MLSYILQYKFSILLAVVITIVSLIPGNNIPDLPLFSIRFMDKIVHFSMYGSFAFVSLLESRCSKQCLRFHLILLSAIFVMSMVIEILQATLVATRAAEWLDLAANILGIVTGYVAFLLLGNLRLFRFLRS